MSRRPLSPIVADLGLKIALSGLAFLAGVVTVAAIVGSRQLAGAVGRSLAEEQHRGAH